MRQSIKLAGVSLAALVLLLFLPGAAGLSHIRPAEAACTTDNGTLRIRVVDQSTGSIISGRADVTVQPNPSTGDSSLSVTLNSGAVQFNDVCGPNTYRTRLDDLRGGFGNCDIIDSTDSTDLTDGQTRTLTLVIDCEGVFVTPTPTSTVIPPTPTPIIPGVPASLILSAVPTVSCSGNTIVTAVVRDSRGNPVLNGTPVTFIASSGALGSTVAPTIGGVAQIVFNAPPTASGAAIITASAGGVSSTVIIQLFCPPSVPVAPPVQPPPVHVQQPVPVQPAPVVVATPRVVSPAPAVQLPRTGEGPDTADSGSSNAALYAGIGLMVIAGVGIAGYWKLSRSRGRE